MARNRNLECMESIDLSYLHVTSRLPGLASIASYHASLQHNSAWNATSPDEPNGHFAGGTE
jgi:hypothetical protein